MDPLAQVVLERINTAIMAMPENQGKPETRMSTAGFCIRQMDYDAAKGEKVFSLKQALRMMMGEPIHEMWRKILAAAFGDDYHMAEAELHLKIFGTGFEVDVPGHCDGHIKSLDAVVEVKTVSDNTYAMVVGQGTPLSSHYEQGNIYAHAISARQTMFIYINRDNGEYAIIFAPYSAELAEVTITKWVQHEANKRDGVIAARPYNNPAEAPCWFCDHKERCYEGFEDQVNGGAKTIVDDELAIRLVSAYKETRKTRLVTAKAEEGLRADIAQEFIRRSIKEAMVPGVGKVIVKLLKNNEPTIDLKEAK